MKPRKLIREHIVPLLQPEEVDIVTDGEELNYLYGMKVQEEVMEVMNSDCRDVNEFADLIDAAFTWAETNGFTEHQVLAAILRKQNSQGKYTNLALNNLNPDNPSNDIYFLSL